MTETHSGKAQDSPVGQSSLLYSCPLNSLGLVLPAPKELSGISLTGESLARDRRWHRVLDAKATIVGGAEGALCDRLSHRGKRALFPSLIFDQ